jgi:hypothetical protein
VSAKAAAHTDPGAASCQGKEPETVDRRQIERAALRRSCPKCRQRVRVSTALCGAAPARQWLTVAGPFGVGEDLQGVEAEQGKANSRKAA